MSAAAEQKAATLEPIAEARRKLIELWDSMNQTADLAWSFMDIISALDAAEQNVGVLASTVDHARQTAPGVIQ